MEEEENIKATTISDDSTLSIAVLPTRPERQSKRKLDCGRFFEDEDNHVDREDGKDKDEEEEDGEEEEEGELVILVQPIMNGE